MNSKYYLKFLKNDRMPAHGGSGQWPAPGTWTEEVEPIPCQQGWHLCRKQDIILWMHETLWVVEADGDVVVDQLRNCKVVARRARLVKQVEEWNPKTLRLFAADCAERVLHIFESEYPNDKRPRKAIEAARRFARGEATEQELDDAWGAAWSATGSAIGSAAADATWSSARSATWSAARSAAWSAAWSATRSYAVYAADATKATAWSAARFAAERDEYTWQINHLLKEYLKLDLNDFH